MRLWVLPLLTTLLVLTYVGFSPTGDGSFDCVDPPVVRMFEPEPERDETYFFDQGMACNADARRRAGVMGFVAVLGTVATVGTLLATRRSQTSSDPDEAAGRSGVVSKR